jgi:valyl-tRNA synthetase
LDKQRQAQELSTGYNPQEVEGKWYQIWEEKGYFSADVNSEGKPFAIVMPPPNVTGQLHMGHALDETMQDILTRWRRMQGFRTLWLPGTDHAGIATQAKVEEALAAEGLTKDDLGREAFIEKTWQWKDYYHKRISKQLRLLGSSCDWQRERFTLDKGCSKAVRKVFVALYEKGLIYRGNYLVNWCSKCQTTISDIEVEHQERSGHLWHLRYPFADGSGYVVVATTRPETLLGDTAVAVHPQDERYQDSVGKLLILPIMEREIPVIADDYVDPQFGSGAVKITPAHDPNDFEMGKRHHLEQFTVIGRDGKMSAAAGKYAGMEVLEAREKIVEEFKRLGLLEGVSELQHSVGECYRCNTVVEPLVSPQWFVKMAPLAEPAIKAVKQGDIKFVPARFTKTYLDWMENIRDWCISRQLWWGHRIPVWYCEACGEEICCLEDPTSCPSCGSTDLRQDPDVLDTWFSSALWPFSTLGWPEQTADLEDFYPTGVLVTGRDIIFFWVARMIFCGLEFMNEKPFEDVFIHGLVLDAQGRKMSKSLGNGIDPLEIIEKYGADALRFTLVTGNTPGNDLRFQEERLEAARNFANKVWNASRFVLMNLEDYEEDFSEGRQEPQLELADYWILESLRSAVASVNHNLTKYELGEAAREIYDFAWDKFCDWYVEIAKIRLYQGSKEERYTAQYILSLVLRQLLQVLHPFMPFITEELWQHLPHRGETIMLAPYPQVKQLQQYDDSKNKMQIVMDVIRAIRNIRAEMKVSPGKKAEVMLFVDADLGAVLEEGASYIKALAQVSEIEIGTKGSPAPEQTISAHVHGVEIYLPFKELIDIEKETKRLQKELKNIENELKRLKGKLNNHDFIAKAPAAVVEKERAKEQEYQEKLQALQERLALFT